MAQVHPLLDIYDDSAVPYFMWDYKYTIAKTRELLENGSESQRIWLMAKIMRDARYDDVWKLISFHDFLKYRARLMRLLGRERRFWEFLYSRWVKQGIIRRAGYPDTSAE